MIFGEKRKISKKKCLRSSGIELLTFHNMLDKGLKFVNMALNSNKKFFYEKKYRKKYLFFSRIELTTSLVSHCYNFFFLFLMDLTKRFFKAFLNLKKHQIASQKRSERRQENTRINSLATKLCHRVSSVARQTLHYYDQRFFDRLTKTWEPNFSLDIFIFLF